MSERLATGASTSRIPPLHALLAAAQHHAGALVLAALWLPLLLNLGVPPLFDVDEGAFSEATREMLASRDWFHTTLNGEPRFDKPVGVYWLQSASVGLFGLNGFALRLPSALCVWTMAWALSAFATPRWGRATGLLGATILVCSGGMIVIARAATADALLNLFLLLAGLDLWRHLDERRTAPLRRAALWIGLGLLTKGPVALLVPGATVLLWVAFGREWGALRRVICDPVSWAILLAVSLPWYVYALDRHGMAFVDGFLLRHNVKRFAGTLEGHGGSPAYYLIVMPLLWLPWSPLFVALAPRMRIWWGDPLMRYLALWMLFVLLFFSAAGTKLPHYALYGGTAVALLLARVAPHAGRWVQRGFWATCLLWIFLISGVPAVLQGQAGLIGDPLYRSLIAGAPSSVALALAGLLAAMLIGALAGRKDAFGIRAGLAAWLGAMLLSGWAAPWWGEALQGPIVRAATFARAQDASATVQWGVHWPSAAVTLGEAVPRRAPLACELALVRLDRLPADRSLERMYEERGVGVVRLRGADCSR